jgi:hypothetical protein
VGYIGGAHTYLWRSEPGPVVHGDPAKVLGSSPRRSRLGGMVLGRPQVRDRCGQRRQADSEIA